MSEHVGQNIEQRQSVEITNRSGLPMTLYVEPWGDKLKISCQLSVVGSHPR